MECIQPTNVCLRKGFILTDGGDQGAKLKVAIRKLDILGYIQGFFGLLIDPDKMIKVINHLELADSIYEIKWIEDAASAENKDEHVI